MNKCLYMYKYTLLVWWFPIYAHAGLFLQCFHPFSGEKSNDKENPDYIPSVNMGYSSENSTNGSIRHARYQRLENLKT